MPQPRSKALHAAKTQYSQINVFFFFLKRISVRMGWNEKYEKKIQTPLHCMLTESPLLKNYSIAQTFPGHEMMIVTLFKNQILNVEFCAYLWLQRREVGQK